MSVSRARTSPRVLTLLKALVVAVLATTVAIATPATASAESPTLVGGWSNDQSWFDSNIGRLEVSRGYSPGFEATWAQTGYASRPGAVDYSFNMAPSAVAGSADRIRQFVATTPENLIINYFHEPEISVNPEAFRSATRIVANIVHAQNRIDGGHRRVEVILMGWTFRDNSGRNAMAWWPGRDSSRRNYVDIISTDVYSDPQGPDTGEGYTNGVNWRTAAQLFDPTIQFAQRVGARWSVSEFGYLEDASDPTRKARAITDAVDYARSHGAVAVEYFDSIGRRGDWRLRHSQAATTALRQAVAAG